MQNLRQLLRAAHRPTDDQTVFRRLQEWENEVFQVLEANGMADDPAVRYSSEVPLRMLPPDDQIRLMRQYRDIIGLDVVLNRLSQGKQRPSKFLADEFGIEDKFNSRIMNVWKGLSTTEIGDRNPYGRFLFNDKDDSLISRVYAGINLQFSGSPTPFKSGVQRPGTLLHHYFGVGSIQRLENVSKSKRLGDMTGKKILTFDIETAGLKSGSIHEIAFKTSIAGAPTAGSRGSVRFNPRQLQRGNMMSGGQPIRLDQYIQAKFAGAGEVIHQGDDFADKVMPFLRAAGQADYVVGHNIESFDISQIFQQMAGTRRYKDEEAFRREVDDLFENIKGKTVDTLRLARESSNLKTLRPSQFLEGNRIYSLENLLLETDLADRIGMDRILNAMGWDPATKIATKGLHFGDVDTLLTEGLLQHLPNLKVRPITSTTKNNKHKARIIRSIVQDSAAITPLTNIRNPKQIAPAVRKLLSPGEAINPIEHEILLSRNLRDVDNATLQRARRGIPSRELLGGLGRFDTMIGREPGTEYGDLLERGRRVKAMDFMKYKFDLRSKGMAFADISMEERLFGTALSDLTSGVADKGYARLARETMISRFRTFDPQTMDWVTRSGKITLPPQMLDMFGVLAKRDNPAMLSLSVVQPTGASRQASVNLAYRFENKADLDNAVDMLKGLHTSDLDHFAAQMGMDVDSDVTRTMFTRFQEAMDAEEGQDLITALRRTGMKRGVSIGQIYGEGDTADRIINFLRSVNIRDRLSDEQMLDFRLPFASMELDETGQGIIRTAGAILNKGLNATARRFIGRNVALAEAIYNPWKTPNAMDGGVPVTKARVTGFAGLKEDVRLGRAAEQIDLAKTAAGRQNAFRYYDFFDTKISPRLPKIGLAAGALGLGGYLLHRKREMDKYDVAFQQMGPETGPSRYAIADVLDARVASGYDGYTQRVDPLATASLTENLYYGSIGHTSTSWDRNSNIYGGVL